MKSKKIFLGLLFGIIAGIIDVIPMIIQKLSWDANLSAFSLWIISGFFIATSRLKINSILKGIIISYLILLPAAILVAWQDLKPLIPMAIMTSLLGGLLGFTIDKFSIK